MALADSPTCSLLERHVLMAKCLKQTAVALHSQQNLSILPSLGSSMRRLSRGSSYPLKCKSQPASLVILQGRSNGEHHGAETCLSRQRCCSNMLLESLITAGIGQHPHVKHDPVCSRPIGQLPKIACKDCAQASCQVLCPLGAISMQSCTHML